MRRIVAVAGRRGRSALKACARRADPLTCVARVGSVDCRRLASGLLAVDLAHSSPPATADVGAPSWWSGDCDAPNWNARAAGAGWSGAGAHRLGASYLGVPVCGPRPGADGAPDVLWLRPGWGHLEWECTELAFRFMNQVYGVTPYGANGGTVVRNYTPAMGGGLVTIANGSPAQPPRPGDIISFDSTVGGVGHVGVIAETTVDAVGNGAVRMLSQNDTTDGWRVLTVSSWHVQPFGNHVAYGWLHRPGPQDPPAPPVPPTGTGRSLNDTAGIGSSPTSVARRSDGRLEQWGVNTSIAGGSNIFRRCADEPGRAVDRLGTRRGLSHFGVGGHERRRPPRSLGHELADRRRVECVPAHRDESRADRGPDGNRWRATSPACRSRPMPTAASSSGA